MLALTRKDGERLVIGNDIIVEVVHARNGSVKLGVQAPRSIPVHREEVQERIASELSTFLLVLPKNIAEQASRKASLAGQSVEHFLSLMIGIGLANEQNSKGVSVED